MGEPEPSLFVTHSRALTFPDYITVLGANPTTNQRNAACSTAGISSCKWERDAGFLTLFIGHFALDGGHISFTTYHSDSVKSTN